MKPAERFLEDLASAERTTADSPFVRVLAAGVLWAAVVGIVWYALDALFVR